MEMDLYSMVKPPDWKDILMKSIEENNIDPWNIDIVLLAEDYLKRVKAYRDEFDIRVPAKVMLAAAILVHYKAKTLRLDEPEEEEGGYEGPVMYEEAVPELVYRPNLPRPRPVTLAELESALERVMREKPVFRPESMRKECLSIEIPVKNLDERIGDVYSEIVRRKDDCGLVMFSEIVGETGSSYEIAATLIASLSLMKNRKIYLWQERLFDDIFIKCVENPDEAEEFKEKDDGEVARELKDWEKRQKALEERRQKMKERKEAEALKAKDTVQAKFVE